jgi:two-component system nitrogen regulation response regulator GlnG
MTLNAALLALVDQLAIAQPGRIHAEIVTVVERAMFSRALEKTEGNQLRAARLLGVNRNTLRKHCRQLDLAPTGRRTIAVS